MPTKCIGDNAVIFLSTPSARRATHLHQLCLATSLISIHALREEGDRHRKDDINALRKISIHALREEGDRDQNVDNAAKINFYPRPPRGERPMTKPCSSKDLVFLSTPSARRATARFSEMSGNQLISIHALREEGDGHCNGCRYPHPYFYPRPPRGGRPLLLGRRCHSMRISIHALREEGDPFLTVPFRCHWHFYPRPPRGGRPARLLALC